MNIPIKYNPSVFTNTPLIFHGIWGIIHDPFEFPVRSPKLSPEAGASELLRGGASLVTTTTAVATVHKGLGLHGSSIPSGKLTVCYRKWPFIVDLPIKNDDVP